MNHATSRHGRPGEAGGGTDRVRVNEAQSCVLEGGFDALFTIIFPIAHTHGAKLLQALRCVCHERHMRFSFFLLLEQSRLSESQPRNACILHCLLFCELLCFVSTAHLPAGSAHVGLSELEAWLGEVVTFKICNKRAVLELGNLANRPNAIESVTRRV